MNRRNAILVAGTALAVAAGLWGTGAPTAEAPPVASPSARSVAVAKRSPVPPAVADEAQAVAVPSSRPGRLERQRNEAWQRLDGMVTDGVLSEDEAEALRAISARTLSRVGQLRALREAGEIGPMGMVVRSIPLRILHMNQMVSALGRDRAREVRRIWRSRKRAEAE